MNARRGLHACGDTKSLHRGQWPRLALVVSLLVFASAQQVSAEGDDHLNGTTAQLPHPRAHRALTDGSISPQLQSDRDTLLNWKQHWTSFPAQNPNVTSYLAGWSSNDSSPCAWQGVGCGSSGVEGTRVTWVSITNLGMTGTLPEDGYANLTACTSLVFAINNINGTIPTAIADMPSLEILDLDQNLLNGGIPPEFEGLLTHLVSLNLSVNNLSDPIPPTLFSGCGSLVALNLSRNAIPGTVPNLGSCSSLQVVDFWKNNFTGSIPAELGSLPLLQVVVLSENQIEGPIPPEFLANCGSLQVLQMARMSLTGPIPSELSKCPNLELINIQSNYLTGPIPPELGQLSKLYCLALGNNTIVGPLPDELSALVNLQYVDLSANQITGSVPASYGKLVNLLDLALQENLLTGTFPIVLTGLDNLRLLDMSHNQHTGPIPSQLGLCMSLTSLLLAYNNFSGTIPNEISSLTSLQVLDFSFNQLTGSIPSSLGALSYLLWLQLSNNQLSGSIPSQLGNCSSLIWLNLCHNELEGSIPASFQNMGKSVLETFDLNRNSLPLVPAEMGECGALERWLPGTYEPYSFLVADLAEQGRICRVWWNLLLKGQLHPAELDTPLAFMQLSYNKLSGAVPSNIGNAGKFSILFFDHNELTGPIPDTLDDIPLYNLNFSYNRINGSIPESLGHAYHLLSMDLSFNELSGPLPGSLGNLTFMDKFNVSFNNLSGPVPLANQFATYSFSVYEGNPYLCYNGNPYASSTAPSKDNLQQCGTINPIQDNPSLGGSPSTALAPGAILGITLACTVFVIIAAGFLICLATSGARAKRRGSMNPAIVGVGADSRFSKVGRDWNNSSRDLLKIPVSAFGTDALPKALAYLDLLVATNNFDDANIIGDGGFGVVYKAKLADGSVVAIKKLIQDGAQGEREFAAEMLTLGNIRHENLVPLLGYCASEREKLLVYKCMTNGSLDEWLHERPGGQEVLSWTRRVYIAAGAARGLAFLHHSCAPVIIHRDMKASNILLDDNFCACVTDFGLARRMYGQDTHVSTIVAGTLGYVPPEYSQTWRSTTKGDVYSFGVVLLELVTGRRPTGPDFDEGDGSYIGGNVVEWVRILLAKRRHEEAYDPIIKNQGASQELLQFLKLAVVCSEEIPSNRPSMRDVTKALDQILLSVRMRSPSQAFL